MTTGSRLAVGAALLAAAALAASADSLVRIVRIDFVAAPVEISPPGGSEPGAWTIAMVNVPMVEGEKVRTGGGGKAEIQFECGSALRLGPDTDISFTQLRLNDAGVRETTVTLADGTALASLGHSDGHGFVLKLGGASVTTPGDVRLRADAPAGKPASLEVFGGRAEVSTAQGHFTLAKDQRLEFSPADAPRLARLPRPDALDRWSQNRDEAFQRALNASGPQAPMDASQSAPPSIAEGTTDTTDDTTLLNRGRYDPGTLFPGLDARMGNNGVLADPYSANGKRRVPVPYCSGN